MTNDALPGATAEALQRVTAATVVGGEVSVSAMVAEAVDGAVGDLDRVAGETRFETAALVAALAESQGANGGIDHVGQRRRVRGRSGRRSRCRQGARPVAPGFRRVVVAKPPGRAIPAEARQAYPAGPALGGTLAIGEGVEAEVRALLADS